MGTALLLDYRTRSFKNINKSLDEIIANLSGFCQLSIFIHAEKNVALEERKRKKKDFKSAINEWKSKLGIDADVFYDVYGTPTGPCEDWFKNMWLTFQDDNIDRIVYLPYDVVFMDPPATRGVTDDRLQKFINVINEKNIDLLLGTYECATDVSKAVEKNFLIPVKKAGSGARKDIWKNFLEDFTILELWSMFPKSMAWFCQQRNDPIHKPKPRTGFFGLSKRLFKEFVKHRSTMMPWAGTVQLLICTAMLSHHNGAVTNYRVAEQFVAELKEPPRSFTDYGVAHQRKRIAYVIANEREYWSRKLPGVSL